MTIDVAGLKNSIDLPDLAGQYTTLKKWSNAELAGPCPRCGGTDRFHVHRSGWWKCYRCHPQPADAIELVMWAKWVDFRSACQILDSATFPERPDRTPQPPAPVSAGWSKPAWQSGARGEVAVAVRALAAPAGGLARRYLAARGITPETWQAWSIGCGQRYHPTLHWQQPCLVIPWQAHGLVKAVQYRFFTGPGSPELERRARFSARPGSERTIFGVDLLGDHRDKLLIVEGEVNALSVWQAVRAMEPAAGAPDLDVISIGAQGNAAHPAALQLARRYRQAIVWTDEAGPARRAAEAIHGARALCSPGGMDANDLLQRGQLGEFLGAALLETPYAGSNTQREDEL